LKTAVAYIRVSTEMQTEYSPDSQLKLIKDYATKNDMILSEVYSDEGISGRTAEKRPAFNRMISDAKQNKFNVIIIYHTSRFARNHEESIVYRNMLKRDGIDVISITQPSVDYKTDILMNALYAVMDERYSIELSENVKRGLKEKASKGIYFSRSPFGYCRPVKKQPLVEDEAESHLVKWIFNRFEDGLTTYEISRELNAKGYKTRTGLNFYKTGIIEILKNPVYKGFLLYNCDGETFFRKADHKPIIDEEQFDRVQEIIEARAKITPRYARESSACQHWLVGIMRCVVCGSTYVHVKHTRGVNRFRCGRFGMGACKNSRSLGVPDAENIVLNYLENLPIDSCNFVTSAKEAEPLKNKSQESTKQLEKALERAKQAYLRGIDSIDEYETNKENITAEISKLRQTQAIGNTPVIDKLEFMKRIVGLVELVHSDVDTKTKNKAMRRCISKISIDPETKKFTFYFFA